MNATSEALPTRRPPTVEGFHYDEPVIVDGPRRGRVVFDVDRRPGKVCVAIENSGARITRDASEIKSDTARPFEPPRAPAGWLMPEPHIGASLFGMRIANPDYSDGERLRLLAQGCALHLLEAALRRPALDDMIATLQPTEEQLAEIEASSPEFDTACTRVALLVVDIAVDVLLG